MARQSPFMSSAQFTYPTSYQQRDARYPAGSTVESAMALNRRPSLLAGYHNHFGSPERTSLAPYYLSLAPVSMGPHVDENSKRSRYPTNASLSVNSQLLPLSIDIKKEQQVYQPQTEAISPTPEEPKVDTNMRDSTIIRSSISKLESEIDNTMKKLHRAKLSQSEIKSQADKSAADQDDDENDDRDDLLRNNGSQTLIEKILHDNRKKAEDGQKILNHLHNNIDLSIPLYQEPNDLQSVQNIRTQYINTMKARLQLFFKTTHEKYNRRIKSESNKYDRIYQEWQKTIEKEEKLIVNKDLTTYRDIFEKTFPELRKTREDKEKKHTSANESATSEQQPALTSNPPEQELEVEEDKMRKSSIIPPIMYDVWQRKHQYFNQNGYIRDDAAEFYKERSKMPDWSPEEKQIFIEKFTQSPKNFGFISSFLENKTTEQCIQFYYMTKKTENYKNLLRKQTQANRRKAKQNTTTTTTTLVTSSTTIETTLVTKVTSSNTIVSSTSQQVLGQSIAGGGQDADRAIDRIENDEDRRETNPGDGSEEKRANKNRCQLLSCTTEKTGKKKNRKNRLRAFPNKWNDLTQESREAIRRSLQIPQNVQRCCTRCYDKLIIQVRQRQTNNQPMEEEDDDDDEESSKMPSTITNDPTSKQDEEWTENDIDAFTEALHKFSDDWPQIAQYVRRSEQSCRAFYLKHRKQNGLAEDENNIDEDNGSISGSEDVSHRLKISIKPREAAPVDEDNEDEMPKIPVNEESNDSPHGMVIDEGDEQASVPEEKTEKISPSAPTRLLTSNLITINSLIEKEICKTLNETDKRASNNILNTKISSEKISAPLTATINATNTTQPPPLVTVTRPHSPVNHSHSHSQHTHAPSHHSHPSPNQQGYVNKGSIMRGTPISSSTSPSSKPISVDTSTSHAHLPSHHYLSPRNDYTHHPSAYLDASHTKSSKAHEQQLYLQQQQQQQQQQAAYLRHYSHQAATHGGFPTPSQYLPQQQQQHKSPTMNNHPPSANTNKSMPIETSNTDTFETLRADFVTSRYLTTTHSPNHERPTRHPSEQRSPSQPSTNNQALLPPPAAIVSTTSSASMQSSNHPQPTQQQQQQAALVAASQLLASSGMYSQELLASGLLQYSPYYNSLVNAPFFLEPRLMHELAAAAANNEQMKNLRPSRHPAHAANHSPPELPNPYPNQATKRQSHENLEHMRYATGDYATPIWRTQNLSSAQQGQQMHSQLKSNSGPGENPLLKLNELSRHSARVTSGTERDARSPDDFHLRLNQSRAPVESPSLHFQRSEGHSHHKSSAQEKLNSGLHFPEHPIDSSPGAHLRQAPNVHKSQTSHHPQHYHPPPHTPNSANRLPLVPTAQISPSHGPAYAHQDRRHSPITALSPQQPQLPSHHSQAHYSQPRSSHPQHESRRTSKESISIQEFMKQRVNEFVALSNNDGKASSSDLTTSENSSNPSLRAPQLSTQTGGKPIDTNDQPILIDGDDDDSDPPREQSEASTTDGNSKMRANQDLTRSNTMESEMPERRRDSSIKKILSNQPLEKQEYVEINQKVQNSNVGASKVHSTSELNGLERTNSTGGREATRSRGSITMRMLMGANGIYADGKAQPMTPNELGNEPSNKRAASPNDKSQSLEYLIRGELDRACPTIPKRDDSASSVFHTRHVSSRSSPTPQQRPPSNQSQPSSKRMRTSPHDDSPASANESRQSSQDSSNNVRDPFALQSHSKNSHSQLPLPSSAATTTTTTNMDRNWQSYVQQQYQHLSSSFGSRPPRSNNPPSGSITQGSPISPSTTRAIADSQQYQSASNNQLVNPRYSYYMNKNEPQHSPSGQAFQDYSPKGKFARRSQQALTSPSDHPHDPSQSNSGDHSSNLRSPPVNPLQANVSGNTPPAMASPVSSSASPTTSVSSNSAHPLKKRLISEYELEQQQQHRNSPATISPVIPTSTPTPPPAKTESTVTVSEQNIEDISDAETAKETGSNPHDDTDTST